MHSVVLNGGNCIFIFTDMCHQISSLNGQLRKWRTIKRTQYFGVNIQYDKNGSGLWFIKFDFAIQASGRNSVLL